MLNPHQFHSTSMTQFITLDTSKIAKLNKLYTNKNKECRKQYCLT